MLTRSIVEIKTALPLCSGTIVDGASAAGRPAFFHCSGGGLTFGLGGRVCTVNEMHCDLSGKGFIDPGTNIEQYVIESFWLNCLLKTEKVGQRLNLYS